MLPYFAQIAGGLLLYMTVWYGIALWRKRNDVADIAWGIGFIFVAIQAALLGGEVFIFRKILVFALVAMWGLRLAIHIALRAKGKKEDFRYNKWREEWGKWFLLRSYLQVFVLQGVLLLLIATPILLVMFSAERNGFVLTDIIALLFWIIGFFFEAVGDFQLRKFKSDPENSGKIMKSGLWKYTRHPNYFGEVLLWWGIGILALPVPYGIWGLIGPLTITILIAFVSGIPMLEEKYEGNPEFEEYKSRTGIFFPWPPRQ